jgi:hypothetical protein
MINYVICYTATPVLANSKQPPHRPVAPKISNSPAGCGLGRAAGWGSELAGYLVKRFHAALAHDAREGDVECVAGVGYCQRGVEFLAVVATDDLAGSRGRNRH